jgi:hypothetical protein
MNQKQIFVTFAESKTEEEYEILKEGKFQDRQLYRFIERAQQDLKSGRNCGIKMPKKLWPKAYVQKYKITNLWKYDLPNSWRLIYTIKVNDVMILNIILEWFSHKDYEKRFRY